MVKINVLTCSIEVNISEKCRVARLKVDHISLFADDIQNITAIRKEDEDCCQSLLTIDNLITAIIALADYERLQAIK